MTTAQAPIDETRCPLCGEDNDCLNIKRDGDMKKNCWCNDGRITFPAELIAKVPTQLKHKACICRSCAEKHFAN